MDTWHLFTSGGTPADMRSLRGEQVVHAHVTDAPAVEPFNAEVRALPPEERVAAVAASVESVWP